MFFIGTPVKKPEDTASALADPEKHWRKGYSAYELAYSWVGAGDIPPRVRAVLDQAPEYHEARMVEAFFEKETELRSRGRPSQTDLLALIETKTGFAALGVEGKVNEPFGLMVQDWRDGGAGKEARLNVLCGTLGLDIDHVGDLCAFRRRRPAIPIDGDHLFRRNATSLSVGVEWRSDLHLRVFC